MAESDFNPHDALLDHQDGLEKQPAPVKKSRWPEPYLCGFCCFDALPVMMLMCICFLTFGSYYVYDTPGAIQTQLTRWFGDSYTNSKNLMLYSIYSWPNTILALFGGVIVDRWTGVRLGTVLFMSFICLGQLMFSLGVQSKSYWVCFAGRFVFGLGGESLTVTQNTYVIRWFQGPYLALAFGLVLAVARIGSAVNFLVSPIFARESVLLAVWIGMGTCGLSLVMCLLGTVIDKYGEKRFPERQVANENKEVISLRDVKAFPASAFLLMFITLFFYMCVLVFYSVASDIMQNTGRKFNEETATNFLAIPNFVSIVFSPLFGRVVDRYGRALYLVLVASCMMIVAHLTFFGLAMEWFFVSPIIVMFWLGIGYALGAASLWPTLALIIPPHMQATGYGCMTAVQNMGLALFPLIIGSLQNASGIDGTRLMYTLPLLIFIGCAGVAILLTLVLLRVDKTRHAGQLNASALERAATFAEAQEVTVEDGTSINDGSAYSALKNVD